MGGVPRLNEKKSCNKNGAGELRYIEDAMLYHSIVMNILLSGFRVACYFIIVFIFFIGINRIVCVGLHSGYIL